MSAFVITIIVVAASGLVILLIVLAPWRGSGDDALEPDEYYALLAGEDPADGDERADESDVEHPDDESGPSAGDVSIP